MVPPDEPMYVSNLAICFEQIILRRVLLSPLIPTQRIKKPPFPEPPMDDMDDQTLLLIGDEEGYIHIWYASHGKKKKEEDCI